MVENKGRRLDILDVIRGFVLLGILIANLLYGYTGYLRLSSSEAAQFSTIYFDRILLFFYSVFIDGKFYSIFSFLFGVGFGLQLLRVHDERQFSGQYQCRVLGLLLIGIVHAFFWSGDILILYALLAFVLLQFKKSSNQVILTAALICLTIPLFIECMRLVIFYFTNSHIDIFAPFKAHNTFGKTLDKAYSHGNFYQIIIANLEAIKWRWGSILSTSRAFRVLGLFLLGCYCARKDFFSHLVELSRPIKTFFYIAVSIGLFFNIIEATLVRLFPQPTIFIEFFKNFCYTIGVPFLALSYVAMISLLYQIKRFQYITSVFIPAGKMALTNYLMQTFIGLILFRAYGFGFYGMVSATGCFLIAPIIYTFQVGFSYLWLKYFRMGPVEWLWRSFANSKIESMHKDTSGNSSGAASAPSVLK